MCFFLDPSPVRRVPIQTGIQRKLNFVSVRTIKGSSSTCVYPVACIIVVMYVDNNGVRHNCWELLAEFEADVAKDGRIDLHREVTCHHFFGPFYVRRIMAFCCTSGRPGQRGQERERWKVRARPAALRVASSGRGKLELGGISAQHQEFRKVCSGPINLGVRRALDSPANTKRVSDGRPADWPQRRTKSPTCSLSLERWWSQEPATRSFPSSGVSTPGQCLRRPQARSPACRPRMPRTSQS